MTKSRSRGQRDRDRDRGNEEKSSSTVKSSLNKHEDDDSCNDIHIVRFGGQSLSTRSTTRREGDSPPPPSVSERRHSPSLPRKIRSCDPADDDDEKMNMKTPDSKSTMMMKETKSEELLLSSEFGSRLMNEQSERDPFFYYEVKKTLGAGSMGSVDLVHKRRKTVGGSARKKVRDTITKYKKNQECFQLPCGIGGLFRLCMDDKLVLNEDDDDEDDMKKAKNPNNSGKDSWWTASTSVCTSDGSGTFDPASDRAVTVASVSDRQRQASPNNNNNNSVFEIDYNDVVDENIDDEFSMPGPTTSSTNMRGSVSSNEDIQREYTYAMKSIHLKMVDDDSFVEELKNEIAILKKLDHPHVVKPIETFQWKNQIFIVMQVCSGGDLYKRDPYTEEESARVIASVLGAVAYLHSNNVAHRDLKYENILYVNSSPKSSIKLIDFGLSKIYGSACKKTGKHATLTDGVGTIYTMAPEVLRGSYTRQADVWSVGVVAYMLLSSQMPFYGQKRQHIVEQILSGKYDFRGRRWRKITEPAKDFVRDLLVIDPEERLDAERASSCTWLNKRFNATIRGPREKENIQAGNSMTRYAGYTKLKKMAMMVVAHRSTCEEIGILRKVFQKYSTGRGSNGQITYEGFCKAWKESGFPQEDTKSIFAACDLDGSGRIRYTEFLAATIEAQGDISEERLAEAFDRFDKDDSGCIGVDDLAEILGKNFPRKEIQDIITRANQTGNGSGEGSGAAGAGNTISYAAFLALWEEKNVNQVTMNRDQCNRSTWADKDENTTTMKSSISSDTLENQEAAISHKIFLKDKHADLIMKPQPHDFYFSDGYEIGEGVEISNANLHDITNKNKKEKQNHVGFVDTMTAISTSDRVEQKTVNNVYTTNWR